MEELKAKYRELNEAFEKKYHDVIIAIAEKNHVDIGIAEDMLKANARGGNYTFEGNFDLSDLEKDYEEIYEISSQILNS